MRKFYSSMVAAVGLACLSPSYFLNDVLLGQDKKQPAQNGKQPEKVLAAEIEALVKQLGDTNFAVREQASKRLASTPGAVAQLRPLLKHDVLEIRRRIEGLVESLSAKNFKSLLRAIVARKQDVPLDLLVDVVVENQEHMDEEDWKEVLNVIACVRTNHLPDAKTKTFVPDPKDGFSAFPLVRGESLASRGRSPFRKKVVGNRIGYAGDFTSSVVITSGPFECSHLSRSALLVNGGILMHYGPNSSLVIANGDIKCENIGDSLVIASGSVNVDGKPGGSISRSIIVCDGKIECGDLLLSTVVARRHVHAKKNIKSSVRQEAADAAKVSRFSLRSVGLTLAAEGKSVRVEHILPGSRASKCGFRVGDALQIDAASGLADVDAVVRRRVAKEAEPAIPVRRNGEPTAIILRLWD